MSDAQREAIATLRERFAEVSARLAKAERLLRDVRGTLRTDQHDGHRRIGSAIDKFLRATDSAEGESAP